MHAPNEDGTPSRSVLARLLIRSWEYRHPRVFVRVRFAAGAVLAVLGVIVLSYGYWAGLLVLAAAVVPFWIGYWIYQTVVKQPAA